MATTFEEVKRFIDEAGLKYDAFEEHGVIAIGFSCEPEEMTFRDDDGDPYIRVLVRIVESGELVAVFSPNAWSLAQCDHPRAVCEAATRIQSHMKLIRFDFDDEGHLQPNIEIPLEQSPLCAEQLQRAIAGILLAVRRYDAVFHHAGETGQVDLGLARDEEPPVPPPDVMQILELGDAVGGIDALERLLGGGDTPPVQP